MDKPTRKYIRLQDFDYSQDGAYFITICIQHRKRILSRILPTADLHGACAGHPMNYELPYVPALTPIGEIVQTAIDAIPNHYGNVRVDNYVIMPDHVHLLIRICHDAPIESNPTVSRIVQQFKGYVSKQVGQPIWQPRFYDHVIRNDKDYLEAWEYIDGNPAKSFP